MPEKKMKDLLSQDSPKFWIDPTATFLPQYELETWPTLIPCPEGVLKSSSGSVNNTKRNPLTVEEIEPFGFDPLMRLKGKIQKNIRGFINLATGKPSKTNLLFDR